MDAPFSEFCIPGVSSRRMLEDIAARYAFAARFADGEDVLDIACGSGFGAHALAVAGAASVVGVDLSEEALSMAKARYVHPALRFVLGDLLQIPYHEATFGMAMCSETIEHTTEYRRALAELHRVLRPGGVLVVTTPNRLVTTPAARRLTDPIPYPYHTQEFTAGEMTAFLREAGFGEVSVYGNRQQVLFPTRVLRHLYKRLRDPNHRQSPAYEPKKRFRQPRNLLFVARKEP